MVINLPLSIYMNITESSQLIRQEYYYPNITGEETTVQEA